MGVSAVPGSGKTWTLTRLAAKIVAEENLGAHQEVLVVTLVNAAVDNFAGRIGALTREEGLIPEVGYRVSTLHTLAHEVVRSRPDLVGLTEDFHVIDERAASQIVQDVTQSWLRSHSLLRSYLAEDISGRKRKRILAEQFPSQVKRIAQNAIRHAKSHGLSAGDLKDYLAGHRQNLHLAEMAAAVYRGYEEALRVRSAVDFDDLIRHADYILKKDTHLTRRLREQWPYVLEDEAQDSSKLQESILRKITGEDGNWVRVGDPNQAIYESFTTADPRLLRAFLEEADESRALPASGRSQPAIITLSNELIRWSGEEHPVDPVRGALAEPLIQGVPEGDPQPNPAEDPERVAFVDRGFSEEEEIHLVAKSLKRWLAGNPDKTAAVLTPIRNMGMAAVEQFEAEGIPYTDSLLKLTTKTRQAARRIERIIEYLADPASAAKLANAHVHWRYARAEEPDGADVKRLARLIAGCERVEEYLWPDGRSRWLEENPGELRGGDKERLEAFREQVRYWLGLSSLPIGQLVIAIAQDLFTDPERLALAQKFAGLLRRASSYHPGWGLPQLTDELRVIADNERRFEGLGQSDTDFDPDAHAGEVAVTTMHGAKGLEWDRVHLIGVNDYHFPSAQAGDKFMPERWYYRDGLNLQAETLAQIDAAMDRAAYTEKEATFCARHEYARERLRLLYVGLTRAREELMVTSNIGRFERNEPALAFHEMSRFIDGRYPTS